MQATTVLASALPMGNRAASAWMTAKGTLARRAARASVADRSTPTTVCPSASSWRLTRPSPHRSRRRDPRRRKDGAELRPRRISEAVMVGGAGPNDPLLRVLLPRRRQGHDAQPRSGLLSVDPFPGSSGIRRPVLEVRTEWSRDFVCLRHGESPSASSEAHPTSVSRAIAPSDRVLRQPSPWTGRGRVVAHSPSGAHARRAREGVGDRTPKTRNGYLLG
jgi:hypothetical protein